MATTSGLRRRSTGRSASSPTTCRPAGDGVLSLAGLYELWANPSLDKDDPERWLRTVTIITTDATGPAGEIIWSPAARAVGSGLAAVSGTQGKFQPMGPNRSRWSGNDDGRLGGELG